jgi:hypothetical protein
MAGVLAMPITPMRIKPRSVFPRPDVAVAVVIGLLLMHVLALVSPEAQLHRSGHMAVAYMAGSSASLSGTHGAAGGGGIHAGAECLSSATKSVGVLPGNTAPVWAARMRDTVGVALPGGPHTKADLFFLCVMRR